MRFLGISYLCGNAWRPIPGSLCVGGEGGGLEC